MTSFVTSHGRLISGRSIGNTDCRFYDNRVKRTWVSSAAINGFALSRRQVLNAAIGGVLAASIPKVDAIPSQDVERVLKEAMWPETWPYSPDDFRRFDESDDGNFYSSERLVYHIDENAVRELKKYNIGLVERIGKPKIDVLDLCASWDSFLPPEKVGRVVGLGMNEAELQQNPILTGRIVRDLNKDWKMPFEDASFDLVVCAVSIEYLNHPLQVCKEIARVLRPGGTVSMAISNRMFPTKAISLWTSSGDLDHIYYVGSLLHYAGGFSAPVSRNIVESSIRRSSTSKDPLFAVEARRFGY